VGGFIVTALVLDRLVILGRRFFRERSEILFLACVAAPLLAWLVYAAQAPHIFASQFGGQFIRKAAATTGEYRPHGVLANILYPVQFGPLPEATHDWGFVAIAVAVAGLFFTQARGRERLRVIGLWALSGLALNLLVHEEWYPVYFALPVIILLGACATAARGRMARVFAVTVIAAGILGNVVQICTLHGKEYLTWKEYQDYSSSIAQVIPPGSSVVLAAIPDPYFGMLAEGKAYRLLEFVPSGVPVDPYLAEKTLNSTDYVVDSGCCRSRYLDDYIRAHGILSIELEVSGHAWPDVRIWRLPRARSTKGDQSPFHR